MKRKAWWLTSEVHVVHPEQKLPLARPSMPPLYDLVPELKNPPWFSANFLGYFRPEDIDRAANLAQRHWLERLGRVLDLNLVLPLPILELIGPSPLREVADHGRHGTKDSSLIRKLLQLVVPFPMGKWSLYGFGKQDAHHNDS